MNTEIMEQLAQRQHFARKFGVEYVDGKWPYLSVESPIGVARIVGEAKHTVYPKGRVFVRGQKSHHDSMIPSLFRCETSEIACLRSAEMEFCDAIRDKIKVGRFKAGNTAALLQHYGFHTTWLDAVDNLFVAYWFASHEILLNADGYLKVCENDLPYGWLYILHPPESVSVVDLRSEHHPLSSRPHVQHGVSIECPCDMGPDLRGYILATGI